VSLDINLIWVLAGCALIGAGSSLVGVFTFLRKESLVGDAVAHALLPGVVLAFMVFQVKSILVLFPGALIAGWLSLLSISGITRYSKIKPDTAIAIVLSVFFAIGVVLLTNVQQGDYGNQTGLDSFIFGKAASMLPGEINLFILVDLILIGTILLFYPYLKLFVFDPEFSKATGMPVGLLNFLLNTLTVLAVATGIQAVGVVLMAALIITPAAAARFLTSSLRSLIAMAVLIGVLCSVFGVLISYTAPSMPTGPWIVMVLSVVAVGSFVLAPKKGILSKYLLRKRHLVKITDENVLKALYHLTGELNANSVGIITLSEARRFEGQQLGEALSRLQKTEEIRRDNSEIYLTEKGKERASRVVRLHRLWELYLNKRMNIAEDHVHHDAEAIEHIITPELEAELVKDLGYPESDPHQSEIPGIKSFRHE
jgi:manganese/zinc/iron transport system permease protein